jgi:DNA primase (bacterial type)
MFDEEGNWHCFGCGAGGDGISFYASLHGLTQGEAAREVIRDFGLAGGAGSRQPSPRDFVREVRRWRDSQIERLRALKEQANGTLEAIAQQVPSREVVWDMKAFTDALYARELIERTIDKLQDATEIELYQMIGGGNT